MNVCGHVDTLCRVLAESCVRVFMDAAEPMRQCAREGGGEGSYRALRCPCVRSRSAKARRALRSCD